jgi:Cof subfamily protein (haloacid dehalogenase superfamily)
MYKLLFSDLDETLLVGNDVPEVNREAIYKMQAQGAKFVVATGRSYNMIDNILKEVHTYEKADEYMVCFNGGLIMECKDHKILNFQSLDRKSANILFQEGEKRGLCMIVFTLEKCYIFNPDPSEVARKKMQKAPFAVMEKGDDLRKVQGEIAKMILVKRDMDYLLKMREEVAPLVKGDVALSFSSNRYMECNKTGVNKGSGISWLAHYLGVDIKDTIAIGDNYNDVSMIKDAGLGACVASSVPEIKKEADYVCEKDYGEGAVAEVIEKFMLTQ